MPLVLPLFTATLITSAFLLFWIQPVIAKLLLPWLGGSASVWNICMMFFQGTVLLGYGYAYLLNRYLPPRSQFLVHSSLLIVGLAFLPLSYQFSAPSPDAPTTWLLTNLCMLIGWPLFMITTQAPLLQRWFGHSQHRLANDPYFLYAGSNIGSFLALLCFPFVLEPLFTLAQQTRFWSIGYGCLVLLTLGCAASLKSFTRSEALESSIIRSTYQQRAKWLVLSFAPSSLLLSLTHYIVSDIAAVPLLWIIPLAIYLLTFVLAFAKYELITHAFTMSMFGIAMSTLLLLITQNWLDIPFQLSLAFSMLSFFILSLACNQQLARSRPELSGLTEFYLWLALGGFLGSVFNAIIAPMLFTSHLELPLTLICIAWLCQHLRVGQPNTIDWRYDFAFPALLLLSLYISYQLLSNMNMYDRYFVLSVSAITIVSLFLNKRSIQYGNSIAILFIFFLSSTPVLETAELLRIRNFYGVYTVKTDTDFTYLYHGKTLHGAQSRDPHKPANTYYTPAHELITQIRVDNPAINIAAIGLGTGTIACMTEPKDRLTFYELDPAVAAIAKNSAYFTYLNECAPYSAIQVGDGRLEIMKSQSHPYNLIVVDAFSSDAIPVHLITLEALQIYLSKLTTDGALAFHISNRYIDLRPVLLGIAEKLHLKILYKRHVDTAIPQLTLHSHWVVLSNNSHIMAHLKNQGWSELTIARKSIIWTDNFSNIFSVLGPIS